MAAKQNLRCALRGHAPGAEQIENAGIRFSRCRRCGADLVDRGAGWQPVPKGQRVVWRTADPAPAAPNAPVPAFHSASPPGPPGAPLPQPHGGTILLCDDDPLILDLLEHRLTARGYHVELARNGIDGLARARALRPDAIVLDAMMPGLDGYEVLRRLRETPETRRIPVVMLTSRRQERDVVDALQLGADDFMSKPFIPEELLWRLARLLAEERVE